MTAYYNEHDPRAAAWLRELERQGLIPAGDVDERSIEDIRPSDLAGYTQCHFFAGIGGWPLALRLAGVPDDEPLWTGSCPCQPLSAAGQRKGFADERHLWPDWFWLIDQCRPVRILGEQVASPLGLQWLDLVSADLEGAGYAAGAVDLCAAGQCVGFGESAEGRHTIEWIRGAVQSCPDPFLAAELRDFAEYAGREVGYGAPHIRQRLYWTGRLAEPVRHGAGHSSRQSVGAQAASHGGDRSLSRERLRPGVEGAVGRLADTEHAERRPEHNVLRQASRGNGPRRSGNSRAMGDAGCEGLEIGPEPGIGRGNLWFEGSAAPPASPKGCDWIICTDGKARPTEPGLQPLAHGVSGRVGLLRGYGNAIHIETAANFVKAVLDLEKAA